MHSIGALISAFQLAKDMHRKQIFVKRSEGRQRRYPHGFALSDISYMIYIRNSSSFDKSLGSCRRKEHSRCVRVYSLPVLQDHQVSAVVVPTSSQAPSQSSDL